MHTESPVPARVPVAGRSLHRWLIPLPVVAFVVTVLGFGMHASDGGADWLRVGFIANLSLIVAALVAGIPGLLDFLSIPPGHPARRAGLVHLGLNSVALTLAAANIVVHPREVMAVLEGRRFPLEAFDSSTSLWLVGTGMAVISLSGLVGRLLLVARYHVGDVPPTSGHDRLVPTRPRTV